MFAHLSKLLKVILQSWWVGDVDKRKIPLVEHTAWINFASAFRFHSCLNSYHSKGETAIPCLVSTQFLWALFLMIRWALQKSGRKTPHCCNCCNIGNCWKHSQIAGKKRENAEVSSSRENAIYSMADQSTVTLTWNTWTHKDLTNHIFKMWNCIQLDCISSKILQWFLARKRL